MRHSFVKLAVMASFLAIGGLTGGAALAQDNTCRFAFDGDCDEPNGMNWCASGTDMNDCSDPGSDFGTGPGFFAGIYAAPAPTGGGGGFGGLSNPCPHVNDFDCDEPNGLGSCDWGTDVNDCSDPASNHGTGAGFFAGIYAPAAPAPTAPAPVAPPTGFGTGTTGTFVNNGFGGGRGCPNFTAARTAFGQAQMNAGQGSFRVPRITAGGRHALTNCFPGTGWRGYTITRPDYRFFYQGNSPTGQLTFDLTSGATDTVMLINAPDGQWYFNDDSNGTFHSQMTFAPALQGQYDIWAGAYNLSSNNQAELWIYE